MATVEGLDERLSHLERTFARVGLGMDAGRWFPGSLQVVRADADGDGDFDPYTSSSWDGDSFSTGTGTINWTTDFGLPDGIKAVCLDMVIRDSGGWGALRGLITLSAKSTSTNPSARGHAYGGDVFCAGGGWCAVAPDGTSYYDITASGEDTCDIYIRVVAYAR